MNVIDETRTMFSCISLTYLCYVLKTVKQVQLLTKLMSAYWLVTETTKTYSWKISESWLIFLYVWNGGSVGHTIYIYWKGMSFLLSFVFMYK